MTQRHIPHFVHAIKEQHHVSSGQLGLEVLLWERDVLSSQIRLHEV